MKQFHHPVPISKIRQYEKGGVASASLFSVSRMIQEEIVSMIIVMVIVILILIVVYFSELLWTPPDPPISLCLGWTTLKDSRTTLESSKFS